MEHLLKKTIDESNNEENDGELDSSIDFDTYSPNNERPR